MKDLVTVVIPVYKVENRLEKCIKSVISQTYKNLEIILVDDGSPDKCGDICERFALKDERIKVFHTENMGLSHARNVGIENACGDMITFVDSDDFVGKDYVKELWQTMNNDRADITICSSKVYYGNRIIDKSTSEKSCMGSKLALKRMLYDDGIEVSSCMKLYRTKLFEDIRFPQGCLFEDTLVTYRLFDKAKRISLISLPLYYYVMRKDSITQQRFFPEKSQFIKATQKMCDDILKKYPDLKSACERRIMYANLSVLSQLVYADKKYFGQSKKIIRYVRENFLKSVADPFVPTRDKIGGITAVFGFGFYRTVWKIYKKISGRNKWKE